MIYGLDYWIDQLVLCGRNIEPEKYTEDYIRYMRREWSKVGLTVLHKKVEERRKEVGWIEK